MGIRFRCHYCEHELHVKDFQAGKRGKCPECSGRFRIPITDSQHSLPLETTLGEPDRDASEDSLDASSATEEQQLVRASDSSTDSTTPNRADRDPYKLQAPVSVSTQTSPERSLPTSAASQLDGPSSLTNTPSLAALREAPGAGWYVRPPSGGQYGPAAANVLSQWLLESRVTRDSLVWRDGWAEWLAATEVFSDFFGPESIGLDTGLPERTLRKSASGEAIDRLSAGSTTPNERAIKLKRKKRQRNYALAIGFLTFIAIALLAALVVVLVMQQPGPTQPTQ